MAEKSPVWKAGLAPMLPEQWLKGNFSPNCSCAVESVADWACAVHGALWKGGLADISEYKCLSLAQMEAMGRKGDFSA